MSTTTVIPAISPLAFDKLVESVGQSASSSTTTHDIRQSLDRVDEEIDRLKGEIHSDINANWDEISSQSKLRHQLYSQSIEYEACFDRIQTALDEPDRGCISKLLSTAQSHQSIAIQHHRSAQLLGSALLLSTAFQALSTLVNMIDSGNLVNAAQELDIFRAIVRRLSPHQDYSRLAMRAVRRIQELEEDLRQRFLDIVSASISFQHDEESSLRIEVTDAIPIKSNNPDGALITWNAAIHALNALGGNECKDEQLTKMAKKLLEKVAIPLIQSATDSGCRLSLSQYAHIEESQCVLILKPHDHRESFNVYDSLRLLLSNLQRCLLTQQSLRESFANYFIPTLHTELTSKYLHSSLPLTSHHEPYVTQLPELLSQTTLFQDWLFHNGWLDYDQLKTKVLTNWCQNIQEHYVRKVATRILEMARKEMIDTQWESVTVPWQIFADPEPTPSPKRSQTPMKAHIPNLSAPLIKSGSTSASTLPITSSSPLTRNFTDPVNQSFSLDEGGGFKSLFNFVSSVTNHIQQPQETTRLSRCTSPEQQDLNGYKSLFDFPRSENLPSDVRTSDCSSPYNETTASLEIIEQTSDALSTLPDSVIPAKQTDPRQLASDTIESEEDVDWDMGGEASVEQTMKSMDTLLRSSVESIDGFDEDVEEDAWGLDKVEDDLTPALAHSQSFAESSSRSPSQRHAVNNLTLSFSELQEGRSGEEEEEPDPDAWGFEPEQTDSSDRDEVLRLRGGMSSAPNSDDGWGLNDEPSVAPGVQARARLRNSITAQLQSCQLNGSPKEPISADSTKNITNAASTHDARLVISLSAQRVVQVANDMIMEAMAVVDPSFKTSCLSQSHSGLIGVALDVFDLYRIVMPTYHRQLLDSVPALSIQFANDCEWLAKQIKSIPQLHDEPRAKSVSRQFSRLGMATAEKQVVTQLGSLMECLDEAEGFIDTSDEQRYQICERACKQLIYTLERLSQAWKPVMLGPQYLSAMGRLVEEIISRILREIEAQSDISAEESKRLNVLCKSLHRLSMLFGDQSENIEVSRFAPSWFKFCFLSELLEASMADIMWMHQEGLLLEFSVEEIANLIKALFADSDLRAKNIDIINSAQLAKKQSG